MTRLLLVLAGGLDPYMDGCRVPAQKAFVSPELANSPEAFE